LKKRAIFFEGARTERNIMQQDAVTLRLQVKEYHCMKLKGWDCLLAKFAGVLINQKAQLVPSLLR
jgi:hypothetical protein